MKMRGICRTVAVLASSLLCSSVFQSAQAALDKPVRVEGGLVQGTPGKTKGFETFKGLPYAAPPVGNLRWRPPAAVIPWKGVRPADKFADDCLALAPMPESTASGASEDCLYLNVWTPANTAHEKLPVMIWIYGGAFVSGSPSYPRYDGDGLNRKGVILVSLNFRTGVLGFLSHPLLTRESPNHASGNYGVLDTIAALKWVRSNIAQFGGDASRITIFGQSSGSQTVNLLTVSPLAKDLFQRVIGESGAGFGEREPHGLADAEKSGAIYTAAFGKTLDELRGAGAKDLLAAAKLGQFEPVVDGWVLPEDPHAMFAAGRQNDVPALVGSNADEAQLSPKTTSPSYETQIHTLYGARADDVLQRFPVTTDDQAPAVLKKFKTLVLGDFNVGSWAAGATKTGKATVFQYRFTHVPPSYKAPGQAVAPSGAYHGAEILYAFNNLNMQDRAWTDDDRRLQDTVSSYWTNFAKTDNPNGAGLPQWPSVQAEPTKVLEIGDDVHLIAKPNVDEVKFLDGIFYGADGLFTKPHQ